MGRQTQLQIDKSRFLDENANVSPYHRPELMKTIRLNRDHGNAITIEFKLRMC